MASCSAEGSPQTDDGWEEKEEEAAGQCSPVDQLPLLTMAAFHPQFHLPHQADQLVAQPLLSADRQLLLPDDCATELARPQHGAPWR